jgi:hypothetical protein
MKDVDDRGGRTTTGRTTLRQAMRIIIESGAMYTFVVVITFITYVTESTAVYPMSAVVRGGDFYIQNLLTFCICSM